MADEQETAVVSDSPLYKQALAVVVGPPITGDTIDRITDVILKLRDATDCSKYLQGGCLARLYRDNAWRKKSPNLTWMEFVDDVLGMGYRKVMYLISIYERASKLGCTADQLDRVGWVKARNILRIATKEDVDDWLARAENQTSQEVERDVRKAEARRRRPDVETIIDVTPDDVIDVTSSVSRDGAERIVEPLENFTVRMTVDQRKSLVMAIEQIAAENSPPGMLMSRGAALDLMATEWIGNHLPREQAIEWFVAQLARVYGVDIQIMGNK